ncbi:M56 family metallopeptidase [Haloferula sp. BvORR071]|uniref:M56 family metallopeptidase n=1 Tax=Haloferula sp. BvORR071 TaxID=1396141 RepID=UPI0005548345|nr:M56 family metallopeptidase [Haloferula sp. BvORR071]
MNFIESMFEWLLATTLRASAMAVAILGIQFLLRRWLPPQWRHALWVPFLLVLALPVLPKVPFGIFPQKVAANAEVSGAAIEAETSALPLAEAPAAAAPIAARASSVNPWAITWLAGSVIMLGIGIASYQRNMRRIKRAVVPLDASLRQSLAQAAREVGLQRKTLVIVSTAVDSPAVTGLLRPTLLLPAGFPSGFSESQARLILLHEFTHLKRFDLPVNWLTCIFQAMHWFNPILWFAFARLRADRESACDAQVLSLDKADHRADYGHALLKLQSATPQLGFNLGFVGIFERNSELKTRIRNISSHRKAHPAWRLAGATLIGALTVLGATEAQERKPEKPPAVPPVTQDAAPADPTRVISNKLTTIVIPVVKFENTSLEEAVDFIRTKSKELDTAEKDPAKKGVNFIIRMPREGSGAPDPGKARITMDLKNVTMISALQKIADQTKLRFSVDESGLTFLPADHKETFQNLPPGTDIEKLDEIRFPDPPPPKLPAGKAAQADFKIVIPTVEFVDVSLTEAVASLNKQAKENAKGQPVFPVVLDAKVNGETKVQELRLRNVPLTIAVQYLSEVTKSSITANDTEIRITRR